MLTTCPECSGKLSSAAPMCPHCGYVQKSAAPAAAAASKAPEPPPPDLVLPSEQAVRKAARRTWSEWVHSSIWRLLVGAVILLVALGLMVLVFFIALRMNDDRGKTGWRDLRPGSPVMKVACR